MLLIIRGHSFPGRTFEEHTDVHVGVPTKKGLTELVPGDAGEHEWRLDIAVTADGDFRGPCVQGKKGERFVYLTWVDVHGDTVTMFRRAKLMLADAPTGDVATAIVTMTDGRGGPRAARLKPPAVTWAT